MTSRTSKANSMMRVKNGVGFLLPVTPSYRGILNEYAGRAPFSQTLIPIPCSYTDFCYDDNIEVDLVSMGAYGVVFSYVIIASFLGRTLQPSRPRVRGEGSEFEALNRTVSGLRYRTLRRPKFVDPCLPGEWTELQCFTPHLLKGCCRCRWMTTRVCH